MANQLNVIGSEEATDGSGVVRFDIEALESDDTPIPGAHHTVSLPYGTVVSILAESTAGAKKAAFAAAVVAVDSRFSEANLAAKVLANTNAAAQSAAALAAFSYPVKLDAV